MKTKSSTKQKAGNGIKRNVIPRLLWREGILKEWSIVGMNHYHIKGKKYLFVSMAKNGKCITEEGLDNVQLWKRLLAKANVV